MKTNCVKIISFQNFFLFQIQFDMTKLFKTSFNQFLT